jgi:imidazolonepropionase-like amidohydrolase
MHDVGVMFVSELNNVGVNMLVGQDNIKPEGTFAEMKLMKEAGISDIDILRGATILPARWLGIDCNYGSVEKGKKADVIILNSNPLFDINAVSDIHEIVHKGKILQ